MLITKQIFVFRNHMHVNYLVARNGIRIHQAYVNTSKIMAVDKQRRKESPKDALKIQRKHRLSIIISINLKPHQIICLTNQYRAIPK